MEGLKFKVRPFLLHPQKINGQEGFVREDTPGQINIISTQRIFMTELGLFEFQRLCKINLKKKINWITMGVLEAQLKSLFIDLLEDGEAAFENKGQMGYEMGVCNFFEYY